MPSLRRHSMSRHSRDGVACDPPCRRRLTMPFSRGGTRKCTTKCTRGEFFSRQRIDSTELCRFVPGSPTLSAILPPSCRNGWVAPEIRGLPSGSATQRRHTRRRADGRNARYPRSEPGLVAAPASMRVQGVPKRKVKAITEGPRGHALPASAISGIDIRLDETWWPSPAGGRRRSTGSSMRATRRRARCCPRPRPGTDVHGLGNVLDHLPRKAAGIVRRICAGSLTAAPPSRPIRRPGRGAWTPYDPLGGGGCAGDGPVHRYRFSSRRPSACSRGRGRRLLRRRGPSCRGTRWHRCCRHCRSAALSTAPNLHRMPI